MPQRAGAAFCQRQVEGWAPDRGETLCRHQLGDQSRRPQQPPAPDNAIYALAHALTEIERYRSSHDHEGTRAYYEGSRKAMGQFCDLMADLSETEGSRGRRLLEANDPGLTRTHAASTMLSGGHAPKRCRRGGVQRQLPGFPGMKSKRPPAAPGSPVLCHRDCRSSRNRPSRAARCGGRLQRRWRRGSRTRRSFPLMSAAHRRRLPAHAGSRLRVCGLWSIGAKKGRPGLTSGCWPRVPRPGADLGRHDPPRGRKLIRKRAALAGRPLTD